MVELQRTARFSQNLFKQDLLTSVPTRSSIFDRPSRRAPAAIEEDSLPPAERLSPQPLVSVHHPPDISWTIVDHKLLDLAPEVRVLDVRFVVRGDHFIDP